MLGQITRPSHRWHTYQVRHRPRTQVRHDFIAALAGPARTAIGTRVRILTAFGRGADHLHQTRAVSRLPANS